jgi:hypothetical protein
MVCRFRRVSFDVSMEAHMQTLTGAHPIPTTRIRADGRRRLWIGRLIGGLAAAFLVVDAAGKLLEVGPVIEGSAQLGYPPESVFGLGLVLLCCVLVYLVPRTAVIGAVLLTGYLGGAVATHLRVGSPLFTHILFPTYVAALLWGSLLLRDPRLRAFVPRLDQPRS